MTTASVVPAQPGAPLLVSREVAAQMLGICTAHLDKLLRTGELPFKKFGRRILVPLTAIQEIAAASDAAKKEQ